MKQTKKTKKQLPRGLRNNNPLNIRKGAQRWQGQTGNDGAFSSSNQWSMGTGRHSDSCTRTILSTRSIR